MANSLSFNELIVWSIYIIKIHRSMALIQDLKDIIDCKNSTQLSNLATKNNFSVIPHALVKKLGYLLPMVIHHGGT